ncbi:MAG: NAD(P)-dependent oxidoreductase, partial [Bacteroidota bacterium]
MKSELGFIGLGLMGAPMAARLLKAGYPLYVHNRTKEKAKPLLGLGAKWCDSPKNVAERSEIVFTMVSDPAALQSVTLGERGTIAGIREKSIHIDTSTVSPKITGQLEQEYRQKGAHFLHSPVLGSIPQATDGTLLLFVGGLRAAFERSEPVLKKFGSKIWHFESVQQATHTKL